MTARMLTLLARKSKLLNNEVTNQNLLRKINRNIRKEQKNG